MKLDELARGVVTSAVGPTEEWNLSVALANFVRCMKQDGANKDGLIERLRDWRDNLPDYPTIHVDELYAELKITIESNKGDGYFLETGRNVSTKLERRGVAIVDQAALRDWMRDSQTGLPDTADLERLRNHCHVLQARTDHGANTLGIPGDALWLTPEAGVIALLLDAARAYRDAGIAPTADEYGDLADRARALLGLSHKPARTCLAAVVTKLPLGTLFAGMPDAFMAPSSVEGGSHPRWRHWPGDYGRTYHLYSASAADGQDEAVCEALPLSEAAEFLYLGRVRNDDLEDDGVFGTALGVPKGVPALLLELHGLTGL